MNLIRKLKNDIDLNKIGEYEVKFELKTLLGTYSKNVVVKDKLICHKLYCKNLQIDNEIECKYITANGNISGKNIKGFYVFCSSINCSTIECEDIDCTKFNADELKVMGMSFKKISYYGLKENPEIDMSNWNNECFLDKRMVR